MTKIGIDSNILTYLINAVDPDYEPEGDPVEIREEKKAILRIFLYKGITYYIGPTVEAEYNEIKAEEKYQAHVMFCNNVLLDGPWHLNTFIVKQRTQAFKTYHSGRNDCCILAEAEEMRIDILLTNDEVFRKRLGPLSETVVLLKPSELWKLFSLPTGAPLRFQPSGGNALLQKTWWLW